MEQQMDTRLAELLASRICHDLVGPIGAVNNGLELLADDEDPDMSDDAVQLAADSARRAATDLRFFRTAYGAAGARVSDLSDLRKLVDDYLSGKKTTLDWPLGTGAEGAPPGFGKLLINIIAVAKDALPLGGALSVAVRNGSGKLETEVTATGNHVELRQEIALALAETVAPDDLTPRNVHAYFTCLLARRMGSELSIDKAEPKRLRFFVSLPG